jgi:hypothetical protein
MAASRLALDKQYFRRTLHVDKRGCDVIAQDRISRSIKRRSERMKAWRGRE